MDELMNKPVGEITIIAHKGGTYDAEKRTIVGGDIVSIEEYKNMIVNSASILMARRMATVQTVANGIQYLAVGVDVGEGGTTQSPNPGDTSYVKLRNELARKAVTSCYYLNTDNTQSATPTKKVEYVFTFLASEANGGIVEMGMFGGDATITKDSGILFNYKTIPIWNKSDDIELTISWKITY